MRRTTERQMQENEMLGKSRKKSEIEDGTGNGAPVRKLCTAIAFVASLIAAMKNPVRTGAELPGRRYLTVVEGRGRNVNACSLASFEASAKMPPGKSKRRVNKCAPAATTIKASNDAHGEWWNGRRGRGEGTWNKVGLRAGNASWQR